MAPSFFATRMSAGVFARAAGETVVMMPLRRIGEPDHIKGVVVCLAPPASDYIAGQVPAVGRGLTAI